jgi:hypothetical protein
MGVSIIQIFLAIFQGDILQKDEFVGSLKNSEEVRNDYKACWNVQGDQSSEGPQT